MNELPAQDVLEIIRNHSIIAIIRGDYTLERLNNIASVLGEHGVNVVEVTLNSQDALQGIASMRKVWGKRMLIGAGTVRTVSDVEQAIDAGAQFLISPNLDLESVKRATKADVLHLPGVFTATEVQAAYAAGCRAVKLFPADALGVRYLKALRAPLDDVDFVPTGGITTENAADYLRAGAAALGVGSALISDPNQSLEALAERAVKFVAAVREARALYNE